MSNRNRTSYVLVKWINNNSPSYDGLEHWVPKNKMIEKSAEVGNLVSIKWYRKLWRGIFLSEEIMTKEQLNKKTRMAQSNVKKTKKNGISESKARKNGSARKTSAEKFVSKKKTGKILFLGSSPTDRDPKSDKTAIQKKSPTIKSGPGSSEKSPWFVMSKASSSTPKLKQTTPTSKIRDCSKSEEESLNLISSSKYYGLNDSPTSSPSSDECFLFSPRKWIKVESPDKKPVTPKSANKKSPRRTSRKFKETTPRTTLTIRSPNSSEKSPQSTTSRASSSTRKQERKTPSSTSKKKSEDMSSPNVMNHADILVSPRTSPLGREDLQFYKKSPGSTTTKRKLFQRNYMQTETESSEKDWLKEIEDVIKRKCWQAFGTKAPALLTRALVKALFTEEELLNGYVGTKNDRTLDLNRMNLVEDSVLREFEIPSALRLTVWNECKSSILHMLKYMRKKKRGQQV